MSTYIPGVRRAVSLLLQKHHRRSGLTQAQLAEFSHVSAAKISRIFSGERPMSYPDARMMLEVLGVSDHETHEFLELVLLSRQPARFQKMTFLSPDQRLFYEAVLAAPVVHIQGGISLPWPLWDEDLIRGNLKLQDCENLDQVTDFVAGVGEKLLHPKRREVVLMMDESALHRHHRSGGDVTALITRTSQCYPRVYPFTEPYQLGLEAFSLAQWPADPGQNLLAINGPLGLRVFQDGPVLQRVTALCNSLLQAMTPRQDFPAVVERVRSAA